MWKRPLKLWNIIATIETIQSIFQWIGISKIISSMGWAMAVMVWSVFQHVPTPQIVVITVVIFTALLWLNIGVVYLWNKRKKKLVSEMTTPNDPPWLVQVLQDDIANLASRIYARDYIWDFKKLNEPDPHIDLVFTMINAAIFAVNIQGLTGRFLIEEHECSQPAELISIKRLPHGEQTNIRFRQRLTRDMANLIISRRDQTPTSKSDMAKKGRIKVSLGTCQLTISPEIEGEPSKTIPLTIGRDYEVNIS